MRAQADGVKVTVPPRTPQRLIEETLVKFCEKLRAQQQQMQQSPTGTSHAPQRITPEFAIRNDILHLHLAQGTRKEFLSQSQPGESLIIYPPHTDFDDPRLQEWLQRALERALRQQAAWLLPQRLRQLAEQHQLPFNNCKINVSKGRWGSCSAQKNINLSCYTAALPAHLRDYVMLHELCHTLEMNHGTRFWQLLDKLTDGKARSLRHELRQYNTHI